MCRWVSLLTVVAIASTSLAADWARFRGPNGSGVSPDEASTPITWSDTENLKWKTKLPGKGRSSPIVIGKRVLVTCWSGGDQIRQRHLVCVDRETGNIQWTQDVEPYLPEDAYRGMFAENGYSSHTPVSDGENVYVFFGKTGALAFDLDGNKLWEKQVGTESDPRGWGSASSPILYKDKVIITASAESEALVALSKKTGEEAWRQEAQGFGSTWGTPLLVSLGDDRTDLVLGVPYEIWGFNPDTGKLRWYCDGAQSRSMCSSLVADDQVLYAAEAGPDGGGALAVRVEAKPNGKATTKQVWSSRDRNRIGTPLLYEGRMYWVSSKIVYCIDAKTGDRLYQSRLSSSNSSGDDNSNRGGGGSRFGGRGRGRGGQDYSSPVAADGKLYYTVRGGDTYVVQLGDEFKQLAVNRFESDNGDFSATPAISDGQIFIRSSGNLYCIAD